MEYLKRTAITYLLKANLAIGKKLVFFMAKYEADDYAETNSSINLTDGVVGRFKNLLLHDDAIISKRWDLCTGCEFLTEKNKCLKCGCFMKVKTRVATASCPIGKWGKEYNFIEGKKVGNPVTT